MARAVLKAMEFDETIRAAANIRYSSKILEIARKLGFKISYYDRRKEPPEIKATEGASIPWGIEQAVKRVKSIVPDIIYHLGDWGKEPMVNVFGRDAVEVAVKIVRIAKELSKIKV